MLYVIAFNEGPDVAPDDNAFDTHAVVATFVELSVLDGVLDVSIPLDVYCTGAFMTIGVAGIKFCCASYVILVPNYGISYSIFIII